MNNKKGVKLSLSIISSWTQISMLKVTEIFHKKISIFDTGFCMHGKFYFQNDSSKFVRVTYKRLNGGQILNNCPDTILLVLLRICRLRMFFKRVLIENGCNYEKTSTFVLQRISTILSQD